MSSISWKDASELTRKLKKTDNSSFFASLLGIGIAILLIGAISVPLGIYLIWANAFAIQHMWQWFVASTFGLSPLTMVQSWGLSIIVAYLTHGMYTCKSKDERGNVERVTELVVLFLKPWLVLGVAYVCAHWFMKVV